MLFGKEIREADADRPGPVVIRRWVKGYRSTTLISELRNSARTILALLLSSGTSLEFLDFGR
jgi:hypothetical protein